jgi:hypothetical protein
MKVFVITERGHEMFRREKGETARTFKAQRTDVLQSATSVVQFPVKIQKQSKISLIQALTLHQDGSWRKPPISMSPK